MIKLTLQQKELLTGIEVYQDLYFGFVQDINNDWLKKKITFKI